MTTSHWRDAVLPRDATLSAALHSLEATALQIVLVLDGEGRLQGTLTDGDVRRALLRGNTLHSPVSAHMNIHPVSIAAGTRPQEALDVLKRMAIRSAPVVDNGGRVVDLVALDELIPPVERETPAVIMAGGRGERLRPLTDNVPKPLVAVGGEPLIDIAIRRLVASGFRRVWVAVHYRADVIQEHLRNGEHLGAEIRYVTEAEPLGTVGAVREVPVASIDTPILVCNSDNVHTIDLGAFVDHHVASGAWATLAVTQHLTEIPFGVVTIQDGFITKLVEKPQRLDWVATGVSVMSQRALAMFPHGQHLDVPIVISELLSRGFPAGAYESSGYWSDVGNPHSLNRVRFEHDATSEPMGP